MDLLNIYKLLIYHIYTVFFKCMQIHLTNRTPSFVQIMFRAKCNLPLTLYVHNDSSTCSSEEIPNTSDHQSIKNIESSKANINARRGRQHSVRCLLQKKQAQSNYCYFKSFACIQSMLHDTIIALKYSLHKHK